MRRQERRLLVLLSQGECGVPGTWGILSPCSLGEDNPRSSGFVPRCYRFSSSQLLPTSLEEMRSENHTTQPVPDQPCGQGLPDSNSIQAKKVSVAGLVEIGWSRSPEFGLRSQGLASTF